MRLEGDYAIFAGTVFSGLEEVSSDPADLEATGWWVIACSFEGEFRACRFATRRPLGDYAAARSAAPVPLDSWTSSMDEVAYTDAVEHVRQHIARGTVYQANICRVLRAPVPPGFDARAAFERLTARNPAPYAGMLHITGDAPYVVMCASPELLLRRAGSRLVSGPIKGTARTEHELLPKDRAENVMIVDLVRNDLSRVAIPGTVEVESLLRVEQHPGLVHLVSDVACDIRETTTWGAILDAVLPAGSVSGAPKSSALRIIEELEPTARGIYCGAFGWVDADRRTAELAVGIRTFWIEAGMLHFGTGAGITWGSDPHAEWHETQLKAQRLLAVMGGSA